MCLWSSHMFEDRVDIHATEVGDISIPIPLSDLDQDYQDDADTVPDERETLPDTEDIESHRGKGKINLFKSLRRNKKNLKKKNTDYFSEL